MMKILSLVSFVQMSYKLQTPKKKKKKSLEKLSRQGFISSYLVLLLTLLFLSAIDNLPICFL